MVSNETPATAWMKFSLAMDRLEHVNPRDVASIIALSIAATEAWKTMKKVTLGGSQ